MSNPCRMQGFPNKGKAVALTACMPAQNPADLLTGNPAAAPLGNANGYISGAPQSALHCLLTGAAALLP